MIEITSAGYEDEEYDSCGNTTMAILKIDRIKIPLCRSCVEELTESMETFNNTVFCYKCDKFIMSRSGFRYGGSCKSKAEKEGKEISEKDAGYLFCVDCMHTCEDAILKEN